MRLGVLDIGSNTLHLLVVDAYEGARPLPAFSHKIELQLVELIGEDGAITPDGAERLESFAAECVDIAEDKGVEEFIGFATSAIRDATNGEQILRGIRERTGLNLAVLDGADEARMTFLAVRRWFGWSAGRLLVLDIGGGSLEMASGFDEMPEVARSAPFGAARLTKDWLSGDPPDEDSVRALRRHVRSGIAKVVGELVRYGRPDRVVATSKTFRQLARVCGAAPSTEGFYTPRSLRRADLVEWLPKLSRMRTAERAELPGVSAARAGQLLAGAIVADAALDLFGADHVDICPWALREGVILRRLDGLQDQWL
ncbi:MAG TPA: Ppx/GppA phosphatase family protein [Actinocrinis sp.]|uniref:Ppx/GppA phosphatase family protein n=1 Tax=Actinocrinis sp. TaxID=1920516 RepID=UPI002DDDA3CF|nr:Ppx/GppA phosphatase family protein [Actinocrinis sp.]HEV2345085.1 Ppx/GppA phosphatase family protein [Actinocrinis sp.]